MNDPVAADANPRRATPVQLWIVGALALLWNVFGAYDYVMTRLHPEEYFRSMMPGADTAAMIAYVDAMPFYASVGWGLGVWGGLIGAVLLLIRHRHAVIAFALSLAGMALSFGHQFLLTKPPSDMASPVIPLIIVAVGIGELLYARAMRAKGVLR